MSIKFRALLVTLLLAVVSFGNLSPAQAVGPLYSNITVNGVEISQVTGYTQNASLIVEVTPTTPGALVAFRTATMCGTCWSSGIGGTLYVSSSTPSIDLTIRITDPDSTIVEYTFPTWNAYPQWVGLHVSATSGSSTVESDITNNGVTTQLVVPATQTSTTLSLAGLGGIALSSHEYADSTLTITGDTLSGLEQGHNVVTVTTHCLDPNQTFQYTIDIFRGVPHNNPLLNVTVNGKPASLYVEYPGQLLGDQAMPMNISVVRLEPGVLHANISATLVDPQADSWELDDPTDNLRPGLNWIGFNVTTATYQVEYVYIVVYVPTDPRGPSADASASIGYQDSGNWIELDPTATYSYNHLTGNFGNHYNFPLDCYPVEYATCTIDWGHGLWSYQDGQGNSQLAEVGVAHFVIRAANGTVNYIDMRFFPDNLAIDELSQMMPLQQISVTIDGEPSRPWSVVHKPTGTTSVSVVATSADPTNEVMVSGSTGLVPGYNAIIVQLPHRNPWLYQVYVSGAADSAIPTPPTIITRDVPVYVTREVPALQTIKSVAKPKEISAAWLDNKVSVDLALTSTVNLDKCEISVSFDGLNWFETSFDSSQLSKLSASYVLVGLPMVESLYLRARSLSTNSVSDWTGSFELKKSSKLKIVSAVLTSKLDFKSPRLSTSAQDLLVKKITGISPAIHKTATILLPKKRSASKERQALQAVVHQITSLLRLGGVGSVKVVQGSKWVSKIQVSIKGQLHY